AEDGIRDLTVTGVQTCALPILRALLSCCDELRLDDQAGGDVSRLLQELPQRERFRLGGRPKTSQLVANRADFICAEETRPQMFVNGRGFLTGEHVPAVE